MYNLDSLFVTVMRREQDLRSFARGMTAIIQRANDYKKIGKMEHPVSEFANALATITSVYEEYVNFRWLSAACETRGGN